MIRTERKARTGTRKLRVERKKEPGDREKLPRIWEEQRELVRVIFIICDCPICHSGEPFWGSEVLGVTKRDGTP